MSAILQTAYTSPNGISSAVVSETEGSTRTVNSTRENGNGATHESATAGSLQGQSTSAPDLDGMTTHAASSVADTSEFPLDFSEDPSSQLFAAESDPEDDIEQDPSAIILHHQTQLMNTSSIRERNVGMSPLFVDTSSATSSPTRSIRPRSPNPTHEPPAPSRHMAAHLSAERGGPLDLGQNNERYWKEY